MIATTPLRVSDAYLDWAHCSAAEEGQPLAAQIMDWPTQGKGLTLYKLFDSPLLVAEIADVAELYVGGGDTDLRAAAVHARAVKLLRERGLSVRQVLAPARSAESASSPVTAEARDGLPLALGVCQREQSQARRLFAKAKIGTPVPVLAVRSVPALHSGTAGLVRPTSRPPWRCARGALPVLATLSPG